jgi:hypothetical protein
MLFELILEEFKFGENADVEVYKFYVLYNKIPLNLDIIKKNRNR